MIPNTTTNGPHEARWPRLIVAWGWLLAPLVAMLALLPTLHLGLMLDDLVQKSELTTGKARTLAGASFHLFRFLPDDPTIQRWMDRGMLAWWTAPQIRLAFWRPLTSATHWLDYQLWPGSPMLMHAHSILWAGLAALLAALLYRRMLGLGVTGLLAALFFALDDAHASTAGWLANRNAVVATTFGVATLLAHHRWRSSGSRAIAGAALGLFAATLLSAEFGAGVGGYLLAYAIFLEPPGQRLYRRLATVLPYVALGLVWLLTHKLMGFGAAHSYVYVDPAGEPMRFAKYLGFSLPVLAFAGISPVPADLSMLLSSPARGIFWAISALGGGVVLAMGWSTLRREAAARFLLVGALLALLPVAATIPSNRLLYLASFGFFGFLAIVSRDLWTRSGGVAGTMLRRGVVFLLLGIHLLLAPLAAIDGARNLAEFGRLASEPALSLPADVADKRLVVVGSHGAFHTIMGMLNLAEAGRAMPRQLAHLHTGLTTTTLLRIDERTVRIEPDGGFLLLPGTRGNSNAPPFSLTYIPQTMDSVYRHPGLRFSPGEVISYAGLAVTIAAVDDAGRAMAVDVRFPEAADDPTNRWVRYEGNRYVPVTLPPVGGAMVLEPIELTLWSRQR